MSGAGERNNWIWLIEAVIFGVTTWVLLRAHSWGDKKSDAGDPPQRSG